MNSVSEKIVGTPRRMGLIALGVAGLLGTSAVIAESEKGDAGKLPAEWKETESGIPVTDALTTAKCGGCHTPDAKGNLSRISWVRATPEGWSQTIKRMVKLNGAVVTPDEARSIVKYLGTFHGLAPEEAKPVMYFAEHRVQDETIIPNEAVRGACASCHAFAQPMSSRRSHREWALLQQMHMALYPQAERQYGRPAVGPLSPTDNPAPAVPGTKPPTVAEVALEWLSKNATLHTPEWEAWRPRIQAPTLAGQWLISGSMPGRGQFIGEMKVVPKPGAATEFVTTTTLRSLTTGKTVNLTGTGLVYGGYSWRGTSRGAAPGSGGDETMRETLWFSPDRGNAMGRLYWGTYEEFGLDVTLTRETGAPALAVVSPGAIKAGTQGAKVHVYGAGLPADLKPQDLGFGAGVTVAAIDSVTPSEAVLTVNVAPDAVGGLHDLALRGVALEKALPVYAKVDYIKVTPETALAHLGGLKYPKGYVQFEAIGYSDGLDGKPNTADDFAIGPVDANFAMIEFPTTTYDDDTKFVGKIDSNGLFTPNVEGPDPARRFMRNNYGEVWVTATSKSLMDREGKPLSGRAYLVTTVPLYKMWDQPEVSK
jgi:quinohemoprotein amine dehydrogenase